MEVRQLVKSAAHLVANGKADLAAELLRGEPEALRHPDVQAQLGRTLIVLGAEEEGGRLLGQSILATARPHMVDIIAAGLPYCRALALPVRNFAYIPVPKCGSSTFKAAILAAMGQYRKRNMPHINTSALGELMTFSDFDRRFRDAETLLIIRHPRDRLRSYWQKNVIEEGSLTYEAGGAAEFYGLETRPGYNDMLRHFARYRQVFRDFRHHSNSINGFAGSRRRTRHIYDLTEFDKALAVIGLDHSYNAARHIKMRSKASFDVAKADIGLERDLVATTYADELALYFS